MSVNLFDLELANIEDDQLHKPTESSENKRSNNHRRLAARRAIEDHMEQQRLRKDLDDLDLELF
ncbi:PA3496 family putative envelope integrity protein [Saccharospirillum alexandrii]|uniref:PA3496 family putative envelope integrity protein n=1 Tax=Saccharospirillum TaxID=231683 RepID=UPI000FDBD285|nr:hypothetical protein [Saccharospirillum alexandrii]